VATNFSRLLRHAWVTVGLFLFPGPHTGIPDLITLINIRWREHYETFHFVIFSTISLPFS